ncbi:uncharacterized protein LOC127749069 [Frankliniella occidentalis]|uniref:Uncharacterized protein LOC127749069 n=1 Tax=Frankliniella occidentalis TaxID=133901 RepID=A0A9C6U4T3_FRAOC|nr:uncharacterized protein LOC127749069 [Frankliniella occidentalis]
MQCSTLFVLAALACCALAQRVPSQDQVTKALMDLDRIYSKRLPSDGLSDPGMKSGDELLKLKQAYKLLMLQDLDNRYKMINRPRYGKRADSHLLEIGPIPANAEEAAQMERGESLLWPRFADRR